jgi:hypothetical protein
MEGQGDAVKNCGRRVWAEMLSEKNISRPEALLTDFGSFSIYSTGRPCNTPGHSVPKIGLARSNAGCAGAILTAVPVRNFLDHGPEVR